MKGLFLILLIGLGLTGMSQPTIYSYQVDSVVGSSTINFSSFQGKKILIVNTASGDSLSSQYGQLKELQLQYKDSLVVVVIPSNSFNSENTSQSTMLAFYSQDVNNKFPVSQKIEVKGSNKASIYQWLTEKSKNGVMDSEVHRPFQKYLISKTGKLIGVFSARIQHLDQHIIRALTNPNN